MQKQNLAAPEPSLSDVISLLKKDVLLNLSAHHVGIIKTFNPSIQTATVAIAYKKTFYKPNAVTGEYEATLADYPLLIDCPVIFLGGGTGVLTFPVTVGDECLVLFNDRDIDDWYNGSTNLAPPTLRLHSISDGFALVGIRSFQKAITGFLPTATQLRFGVNGVTLDATKSQIAFGAAVIAPKATNKIQFQNASVTLKDILQNFVTEITNLNDQLTTLVTTIQAITVSGVTSGGGSSGPIANIAAFAPIATQIGSITANLATIKVNMGVLLE